MGDIYTNPPQSRNEAILRATIDGTEYTAPPQSRIEDLLLELKEAIEQGGGAGGMSKDTYDPDDAVATAGGIAAYVDDEITDLHLGTASTKNSTSVVTQSTDLVESGAVYDALGFGNKNLSVPYTYSTGGSEFSLTYDNNKVTVNGTLGDTDILQPISSVAKNNGYIFDLPAGTFTVSLTGDTANIEPQIVKSDGSVLEGTTITLDTPTTIFLRVMVKKNNTFNNQICYIQLEKGSVATAYEPYHESVSESLDEKADNSVIGTVEDGTNPTKAYAVNEFMVRDGSFCQVTAPVTTSSTWTEGSNYTKKSIAEVLQSLMS